MFGWTGRILDIDLSSGAIREQSLSLDLARAFLGGRGLNSKVLFDRIPPGLDPLSPDNVYCIAPGPLSGTALTRSRSTARPSSRISTPSMASRPALGVTRTKRLSPAGSRR